MIDGPSPLVPEESSESQRIESTSTAPAAGRGAALRDIRRQLTEDELASPGVQKLLLENLDRAEGKCDDLQLYVDRFHEADKRSAVLEEKLKTNTALEILFAGGLAMGSAIIGLAPIMWDATSLKGSITLIVGLMLVIVSVVARVRKQ